MIENEKKDLKEEVLFAIGDEQNPNIITIAKDGTVKFDKEYPLDDITTAFWGAVRQFVPRAERDHIDNKYNLIKTYGVLERLMRDQNQAWRASMSPEDSKMIDILYNEIREEFR